MARVTKNVRWLLTAWVLMAFPAGLLHAQKIGVEDVTPVYDLVKTIKHALPYHDTAYRFTVTRAMINTDYRYVKLTVVMDSTETVDESTKSLLFDYFMHHSPWQLKPLEEHTFDLTLYVLEDGKPVCEYYTYTTLEMQEALSPSIEVKAKRGRVKSMNRLIESDKYPDIRFGFKLSMNNIGHENNIYTFPYFCTFLLKRFMSDFRPTEENAE